MCTNNTCNPEVDCPNETDCPTCGGSCGGPVAESICVVPSQVILSVGQSDYLDIVPDPEDAVPDVEWFSDDTTVVTVGPNGHIIAVGTGFANVFATTANGLESYCFVQVREADVIPVTSVTLDRSSLTLQTGEHCILYDTVCPGNATNPALEWHSDNDDVARVDDGVVYAVGVGETFITAISVDNRHIQDTCTVRVYPSIYVESITLGGENTPTGVESIAIRKGSTYNMCATVCPENATHKSLEWSSNNTSVATVSQNGVITGKSAGRTTICVTALDDSGVTAECDVWVIVPVESVVMVLSEHTTGIERELTLVASVQPVDANNLYWHSSDPAVATVVAVNDSRHGLVTTHAAGYTTIYATSIADDSIAASCKLHVQSENQSLTMEVGETATLRDMLFPNGPANMNVEWTSSDETVATVDGNGVVTAKWSGTTNITAKDTDSGHSVDCVVTVAAFQFGEFESFRDCDNVYFDTLEMALAHFAHLYFNASRYSRVEFGSILYYVTEVDQHGEKVRKYAYTRGTIGSEEGNSPHRCNPYATGDSASIPDNATIFAMIHTHPNVPHFGTDDYTVARTDHLGVYWDVYVVLNTYEVWGYCHADDGSWVEKPVLKNMTFRKLSDEEKIALQSNEGQIWLQHYDEQCDLNAILNNLAEEDPAEYEKQKKGLCATKSPYTNCHEMEGWGTEL